MNARDLAWLPCAAALVLGCGRALAAGDGHSVSTPHGSLSAAAVGPLRQSPLHDAMPRELEQRIARELQRAEQRLREEGRLPAAAKAPSGLLLPLATIPELASDGRHVISNFVDRNPMFRTSGVTTVQDYACGTRSYDTENYNHQGTDFALFPFGWLTMAQEQVAGTAAAPGVILAKADGNPDRNCSFDSPDTPNAVYILHADGSVGWYLHFKKGTVTPKPTGASVEAGEYLGLIGSSGISTAPHLHFELRAGTASTSAVVDPYQGQCNIAPSLWAQQEPYRASALMQLSTHSDQPLGSPSCGAVEGTRYRTTFALADPVQMLAVFRDIGRDDALRWRLFRPDGSLEGELAYTPGQVEPGMPAYLAAGGYGLRFTPDAEAPEGTWAVELEYRGTKTRTRFHRGGPMLSATGAWYDPAQSGHGLMMEVIDSGGANPTLVVTWYAFLDGQPEWLIGTGPIANGEATVPMLRATGNTGFPPQYERDAAGLTPWGELTVRLTDASSGSMSWTTEAAGFSDGSMPLTRLAGPGDINKDDFDSGTRACMTGNWYNLAQSGHGLVAEVIGEGAGQVLVVAWYVYHQGRPYWLVGNGPIADGRAELTLFETTGGDFPPDFDPDAIQQQVWGTALFSFIGPSRAAISWTPQLPGFEPGSLQLQRLTAPVQSPCL